MPQTLVCGVSLTFEVGPYPGTNLCKALVSIPSALSTPRKPQRTLFSSDPKDSGGTLMADLFSQGSPFPSCNQVMELEKGDTR